MLYESARSMATPGGVQPSGVIELLNGRKPQCPVQLRTLRFKPYHPVPTRMMPSLSEAVSAATGGDAAIPRGPARSDTGRADSGGGSGFRSVVVAGTSGDASAVVAAAAAAAVGAPDAAAALDGEDEGEKADDAEGDGGDDIEVSRRPDGGGNRRHTIATRENIYLALLAYVRGRGSDASSESLAVGRIFAW